MVKEKFTPEAGITAALRLSGVENEVASFHN